MILLSGRIIKNDMYEVYFSCSTNKTTGFIQLSVPELLPTQESLT